MTLHDFKSMRGVALGAGITLLATGLGQAQLSDVTQPGDPIIASSSNSPGSEGAANAINNTDSKYLNFDSDTDRDGGYLPSGFTVTPQVGLTLVTGMTLRSANDAPDRDPKIVLLEGSNDGENFDVIATLDIPVFENRFQDQQVFFDNESPYTSYRWSVLETATASTCCMQIAEVELLGVVVPSDITQPGDDIVASSSNSPGSEGVANAIDNAPTKYLNRDSDSDRPEGFAPSGFTVTPSIGATIISGVSMTSANDAADRDPKTVTIEGSNDGENFSLIAELSVPVFTARFQTKYLLFSNTQKYLSYRWTVTETAGNSTCCMQIAEVELLGRVAPQDVTQPGDPIVASSSNSPGSEGVANVIDNQPTKYLNFDSDTDRDGGYLPSGFTVTPAVGETLVVGMSIQSANDAADRDPKLVTLEGSNDGSTFEIIATIDVPAFEARFQTQEFFFENALTYSSYRWTVLETAGNSTCCMQVAEVELLGFAVSGLPGFRIQPVDTPVLVGARANFFVVLDGPWQVQWYRNGEKIVGATQLSYSTDPITPENENDVYTVTAANGDLISTSQEARIVLFEPSEIKSIGLNWIGAGANGAPTSLDPTDIAGFHPQAYWNNLDGAETLVDSDNNASSITLNYEASGTWGSGTGTADANRRMLNGIAALRSDTTPNTYTLSNVPAGNHSVILYMVQVPLEFHNVDAEVEVLDSNFSPVIQRAYIRPQNSDEYNPSPGFIRVAATTPAARSVGNMIRFDNLNPGAGGTITVRLVSPGRTGGQGPGLNGMQLLLNPPPAGNPPVITSHPVPVNGVVGGSVTLSTTAEGNDLSYQWLRNGQPIQGATGPELVISNFGAGNAGRYSVAVSNAAGRIVSTVAVVDSYDGTISDRLVAHWKLDETSGSVASNEVESGSDGSVVGNSSWTAGRIGGAFNFDLSTYIFVPDYAKASKALTVSVWVRPDSIGDGAPSIIKNWATGQAGQFNLGVQFPATASVGNLGGIIAVGPNQPSIIESSETGFPVGDWQHLVMTADGSRLRIYRNGQIVASGDYLGDLNDPVIDWIAIGVNLLPDGVSVDTALPDFFHGLMDDIGIWTRSLSGEEINKVYQAGLQGNDLSTVPPVIVEPPQDVSLVITSGDNSVTIEWDANVTGFVLESASDVNGPWAAVAGVENNSITINNPAGNQYYRLKR